MKVSPLTGHTVVSPTLASPFFTTVAEGVVATGFKAVVVAQPLTATRSISPNVRMTTS
jgi:hypothetical protein